MPLPTRPIETSKRIAHGLVAFKLGSEAWAKFEEHDPYIGSSLLLLALLLAAYAWAHPHLHAWRHAAHLETGVFLAEAAVFAETTLFFFEHGKRALPWIYLLVTVVYFALAVRQHLHNRQRSAR